MHPAFKLKLIAYLLRLCYKTKLNIEDLKTQNDQPKHKHCDT